MSHHVVGPHHVDETVPRDQWIYWDPGFLLWRAAMLLGRYRLWRRARGVRPMIARRVRRGNVEIPQMPSGPTRRPLSET